MKKIILSIFVLLYVIVLPQPVAAHLAGQPPFFKVNGTFSGYYPVYSSSLSDFPLPQDVGPSNYLVNQTIDFEIDTKELMRIIPQDIIRATKFVWDFGDGTKGEGLKNTHSYKKMGSYVLIITADTSAIDKTIPPQVLQSIMLYIVPEKEYKLPKSVILVNGKGSKDPVTDVLIYKFGDTFTFDGSKSEGGDSTITSYFWDFGDGQTSN